MLRRKLLIVGVFALAALLSVATAVAGALRIEAASARAVTAVFQASGHGWATVAVDGLRVAISGTAPDEATRFAALSAAGEVVAPAEFATQPMWSRPRASRRRAFRWRSCAAMAAFR
ncbi:MAG: hypothetical protein JKP98_24700 [Rhodobacteraceae bacterium]|nr:hypothetical protein [Paracoccaceae bacterium]